MNKLSDRELEQRYCDMLDEIYSDCKIAGYDYLTSRALREVDPTAYRCGFADWVSSEIENETIEEIDGKYFEKE